MAGKMELINYVTDQTGLSKRESREAITAFLEGVRANLLKGEKVYLPGLGTFHVVERAARKGRNPATGQEIKIPAQKAIRFKVALPLKQELKKKKRGRKK